MTANPRHLPPTLTTPSAEDIAPQGQSQTDMVLRTVKDLIAKDAVTPDLEKETGMTREQMEQFVKKYEKVKSAPAGPGREIDGQAGRKESGPINPRPTCPASAARSDTLPRTRRTEARPSTTMLRTTSRASASSLRPNSGRSSKATRVRWQEPRSGVIQPPRPGPARSAPAGGK